MAINDQKLEVNEALTIIAIAIATIPSAHAHTVFPRYKFCVSAKY